jgi:hypothetical protein
MLSFLSQVNGAEKRFSLHCFEILVAKYRSKNNFLILAASFALTHRQKNLSVAPLCYGFPSLIEGKISYPKR